MPGRLSRVEISLASTSFRIHSVEQTIASLWAQTVTPRMVHLWLSETAWGKDQGVTPAELPGSLDRLRAEGKLEIHWTENTGPYRKLLPLLEMRWADKNALIATADDDVVYPPDWLESLERCAERFPDAVVSVRNRLMKFNRDGFLPYRTWRRARWFDPLDGIQLFPTGKDGVLYRVGMFDEAVFDRATYQRLCQTSDDIWFRAHTLKHGIRVARPRRAGSEFPEIKNRDNQRLFDENRRPSGNDAMVNATFAELGITPAFVASLAA